MVLLFRFGSYGIQETIFSWRTMSDRLLLQIPLSPIQAPTPAPRAPPSAPPISPAAAPIPEARMICCTLWLIRMSGGGPVGSHE
ncbi:hypothetical protein D9543_09215 [Corynebacterium macginleyi]|uniref:Uncharacterized protein n=1 Tax=Corynebacterium macginleyi TaxID=38290 RepID=A0A3M0G618_9CORY|nr:hypothetical protein D9543_09215 [Corynebacterium macginleyi]RMB64756.1 hypothetical protein D9V82_10520 [Corynebacterium macginleyi]